MTITIEPHNNGYALFATGLGGKAIAGPRILRGPPQPGIRWQHETKEEAEKDAERLRRYLAQLPKPKKKTKSQARSAFEE